MGGVGGGLTRGEAESVRASVSAEPAPGAGVEPASAAAQVAPSGEVAVGGLAVGREQHEQGLAHRAGQASTPGSVDAPALLQLGDTAGDGRLDEAEVKMELQAKPDGPEEYVSPCDADCRGRYGDMFGGASTCTVPCNPETGRCPGMRCSGRA